MDREPEEVAPGTPRQPPTPHLGARVGILRPGLFPGRTACLVSCRGGKGLSVPCSGGTWRPYDLLLVGVWSQGAGVFKNGWPPEAAGPGSALGWLT